MDMSAELFVGKKFSNVCYIVTKSMVSLKLQISQCLPSGYSLKIFKFIKDQRRGNSPGCPVVQTWSSHCCGPGFSPWSGN